MIILEIRKHLKENTKEMAQQKMNAEFMIPKIKGKLDFSIIRRRFLTRLSITQYT